MLGKKILIFLLVIVVILTVLVLVLPKGSKAPKAETPALEEATRAPSLPATESKVVYTDAGFSPQTITVKVGEAVIFENQSSVDFWPASAVHPTHAVYSGTSLAEHCPVNAEAFDACGRIAPGSSWSFIFNKAGSWKYHDHLNPQFTGTVVVE